MRIVHDSDSCTVRVGQFIKPFGFDIQQSSSMREYPERGMFAGYFFRGQRDRGVMLMWHHESASAFAHNTAVYAELLNGNCFEQRWPVGHRRSHSYSQRKNTATANDDAVNTRVQTTLDIVFQEETS